MDVKLPNGRVVRGIPDDTSKAEIRRKLLASGQFTEADFADEIPYEMDAKERAGVKRRRGDPARKRLRERNAEIEEYLATLPPERAQELRETGQLERFGIGLREGVETLGRGIGGLIGRAFGADKTALQRSEEEQRRLEDLAKTDPQGAYQLGELVGETIPSLAIGGGTGALVRGASALPRVAAQIASGGVEGAALAQGKGQDITQGAALGAVGAGVGEALGPVARGIGRKARGVVGDRYGDATRRGVTSARELLNDADFRGRLGEELREQGFAESELDAIIDFNTPLDLLSKMSLEGIRQNPDYLARSILFETQGVTPTRAQITRDSADFLAEVDLTRAPSGVAKRLDEQAVTMRNQYLRRTTKANRPDDYVFDNVFRKYTEDRLAIKDAYDAAKAGAAAQNAGIDPEALLANIAKSSKRSKDRAKPAKAIRQELKARGIIGKDGQKLRDIKSGEAEDIRQTINEERLDDSIPENQKVNRVVDSLRRSLDSDMDRAMDTTALKEAREKAQNAYRELEVALRSGKGSQRKSVLEDILRDKIPPDQVVDKIVFSRSYDGAQVKALTDYLKSAGPEGQKAFESLRADALLELFNKSLRGAEGTSGVRQLSAFKFDANRKKIGPEKMKALFSEEERRFLEKHGKLLNNITPVTGTSRGIGGVSGGVGVLKALADKIGVLGLSYDKIVKAVENSRADKRALASALSDIVELEKAPSPTISQGLADAMAAKYAQEYGAD